MPPKLLWNNSFIFFLFQFYFINFFPPCLTKIPCYSSNSNGSIIIYSLISNNCFIEKDKLNNWQFDYGP